MGRQKKPQTETKQTPLRYRDDVLRDLISSCLHHSALYKKWTELERVVTCLEDDSCWKCTADAKKKKKKESSNSRPMLTSGHCYITEEMLRPMRNISWKCYCLWDTNPKARPYTVEWLSEYCTACVCVYTHTECLLTYITGYTRNDSITVYLAPLLRCSELPKHSPKLCAQTARQTGEPDEHWGLYRRFRGGTAPPRRSTAPALSQQPHWGAFDKWGPLGAPA